MRGVQRSEAVAEGRSGGAAPTLWWTRTQADAGTCTRFPTSSRRSRSLAGRALAEARRRRRTRAARTGARMRAARHASAPARPPRPRPARCGLPRAAKSAASGARRAAHPGHRQTRLHGRPPLTVRRSGRGRSVAEPEHRLIDDDLPKFHRPTAAARCRSSGTQAASAEGRLAFRWRAVSYRRPTAGLCGSAGAAPLCNRAEWELRLAAPGLPQRPSRPRGVSPAHLSKWDGCRRNVCPLRQVRCVQEQGKAHKSARRLRGTFSQRPIRVSFSSYPQTSGQARMSKKSAKLFVDRSGASAHETFQ
eukprot:scaffold2355_cov382-Prasinococcus_capsulatus_cf.AAC.11